MDVPFQLPMFKGFTVDARLREFRLADRERGLESVPFDCGRGRELLDEMRKYFLFLYEGFL
ncbi:MAG: hypothetical protein KAV87_53320 [Desulfobacteraceae bacterium]|nr:hypothetical protein [Desulfobacteraceae bacterium]